LSRVLLPIAIVVAGACIGAGLYFGLRARQVPTSPPGAAPAPPPDAAPASPPVSAPAPSEAQVMAEARAALEGQKAVILQTCSPAAPARVAFTLGFDPAGREVIRGVNEPRGAGEAEQALYRCVRQLALPPLTVRGRGEPTTVAIILALP
jgi:hypothetical protein